MSAPPKVFLSHASEDKAMFVSPVAEALFAKGIDVWLDTWEIRPGDSLIERIFSEGIGKSDAVVVFISNHIVNKPWVKKELSVSAVENITKNLRLIPVRLDKSEVPTVLKDQLWLDWLKDGGAMGIAENIAKTLFNLDVKPELGDPPSYVQQTRVRTYGLTPSDEEVLRAIVSIAIRSGRYLVYKEPILKTLAGSDLSENDILESCQILIKRSYLRDKRSNFYLGLVNVEVPIGTLLEVAAELGFDIRCIQVQSAALILNEKIEDCDELARRLDVPIHLCEAIVDNFKDEDLLGVTHFVGSPARIHSVSSLLRRWLLEANANHTQEGGQ